jgi:hypothetical protein
LVTTLSGWYPPNPRIFVPVSSLITTAPYGSR